MRRFPKPWQRAFDEGETQRGTLLGLSVGTAKDRTFVVNATPICDEDGIRRGVLASFEDVTPLERKKHELMEALARVRTAAEQIREQNRELERLATRDPLTGAFNRRCVLRTVLAALGERQTVRPAAGVCHGRRRPLQVGQRHARSRGGRPGAPEGGRGTQRTARQGDIVARYGGEEFAILLTHTDLKAGEEAAEKFRLALEALQFPNLRVTASLGVSALELNPASMEELLDQADKGLYAAKRTGRNRTVRFDHMPADLPPVDKGRKSRGREDDASVASIPIPFPAVTALISALAYRDSATAEHSRRVADLCALVAEGIVSASDCYVIEIGALLHDIGKIGVPDHILLKPGADPRGVADHGEA